jgi:hypothetical protein
MSTPENPLNRYRSYSYHHLLYVCDSVATAGTLVKDNQNKNTVGNTGKGDTISNDILGGVRGLSTPVVGTRPTGTPGTVFKRRTIPVYTWQEVQNDDDTTVQLTTAKNGTGHYALLINTMTDMQFTIEAAEWKSYLFSRDGGKSENVGDQMTAASIGTIEIKETFGAHFSDRINDFVELSGGEPTAVCYLLKTVFMGLLENGQRDYIVDVKPVVFVMSGMDMLIDESGSQYKINFAIVGHGDTGATSATQSLVDGISFNTLKYGTGDTPDNHTVKKSLESFVDTVNKQYDIQFYNTIGVKKGETGAEEKAKNFRKLKFVLQLEDKTADSYTGPLSSNTKGAATAAYADEAYVMDTKNENTADNGDKTSGFNISFNDVKNIETAISLILKSSSLVMSEGKKEFKSQQGLMSAEYTVKTVNGEKQYKAVKDTKTNVPALVTARPRIRSAMYTNPVDAGLPAKDGRPDTVYVVYYLSKEEIPVTPPKKEKPKSSDAKTKEELDKKYEGMLDQTIFYDYLFTGKNVDVMEYDMNFKMAFSFFQNNLTANHKGSSASDAALGIHPSTTAGGDTSEDKPTRADTTVGALSKPIVWPSNFKANQNDKPAITPEQTDFYSLLSRYAGYNSANTSMKVRGNPVFLNNGTPDVTTIAAMIQNKAPATTNYKDLQNMIYQPSYVKVNVFFPEDGGEIFSLKDGHLRNLVPFWYQGLFRLVSITHTFDNGEFTQQLQLVAFPETSDYIIEQREKYLEQNPVTIARESQLDSKLKEIEELRAVIAGTSVNSEDKLKQMARDRLIAGASQVGETAAGAAPSAQDLFGLTEQVVGNAFRNAFNSADPFDNEFTNVTDSSGKTRERFSKLQEAGGKISAGAGSVIDAARGATSTVNSLVARGSELAAGAFESINDLQNVAGKHINSLIGGVNGIADAAVGGLTGAIGSVTGGLGNSVNNLLTGTGIGNSIMDATDGAIAPLLSAGTDFIGAQVTGEIDKITKNKMQELTGKLDVNSLIAAKVRQQSELVFSYTQGASNFVKSIDNDFALIEQINDFVGNREQSPGLSATGIKINQDGNLRNTNMNALGDTGDTVTLKSTASDTTTTPNNTADGLAAATGRDFVSIIQPGITSEELDAGIQKLLATSVHVGDTLTQSQLTTLGSAGLVTNILSQDSSLAGVTGAINTQTELLSGKLNESIGTAAARLGGGSANFLTTDSAGIGSPANYLGNMNLSTDQLDNKSIGFSLPSFATSREQSIASADGDTLAGKALTATAVKVKNSEVPAGRVDASNTTEGKILSSALIGDNAAAAQAAENTAAGLTDIQTQEALADNAGTIYDVNEIRNSGIILEHQFNSMFDIKDGATELRKVLGRDNAPTIQYKDLTIEEVNRLFKVQGATAMSPDSKKALRVPAVGINNAQILHIYGQSLYGSKVVDEVLNTAKQIQSELKK